MPNFFMLSIAVLFAVLSSTAVAARPPQLSGKVSAKSFIQNNGDSKVKQVKIVQQKSNKVEDITAHLQKTVNRIINGVKSIPKNFLEAERLKKLRKAGGNEAITFTEYGFIEKASEDLSKIFRMVVTIPFSPEFFFYSYIVFPAMASSNPFAWSSMSSGFDADPEDARKRIETLEKRRIQTFISALVTLKGETIEAGQENSIIKRKEELLVIEKALKSSTGNLKNALKDVEGFFMTENDKKLGPLKLKLRNVPGSIVKGCCRSVGIEGLPNIPVINKMNIGEIAKYVDKVRESDDFLVSIGTKNLKVQELRKANHDRCMRVTGRSESALRGQLNEWLEICCQQEPFSRSSKIVLNDQNRRLALMAFHVAREAKEADFSTIYRVLG